MRLSFIIGFVPFNSATSFVAKHMTDPLGNARIESQLAQIGGTLTERVPAWLEGDMTVGATAWITLVNKAEEVGERGPFISFDIAEHPDWVITYQDPVSMYNDIDASTILRRNGVVNAAEIGYYSLHTVVASWNILRGGHASDEESENPFVEECDLDDEQVLSDDGSADFDSEDRFNDEDHYNNSVAGDDEVIRHSQEAS